MTEVVNGEIHSVECSILEVGVRRILLSMFKLVLPLRGVAGCPHLLI